MERDRLAALIIRAAGRKALPDPGRSINDAYISRLKLITLGISRELESKVLEARLQAATALLLTLTMLGSSSSQEQNNTVQNIVALIERCNVPWQAEITLEDKFQHVIEMWNNRKKKQKHG